MMHPTTITPSWGIGQPHDLVPASGNFVIETPRLRLRPPSIGDAPSLWPYVTDPQITQFLAWEPHTNLQQTVEMLEILQAAQHAAKGFHWTICTEGEVAGLISLIDVKRNHRCWTINSAELAYWVGRPHQGKGIATEASKHLLHFAFKQLNFNKIGLYHAAENMASGAIPLKLGFRFVGEQYEAFCKNGQWHSLKQFELLRTDHSAQHEGQHNEC